jgi:D-alanyl-D-alanine carboxypeptidase/D-alanyl-D-alanine-endopeptidase (penicillin-binding protein 4)
MFNFQVKEDSNTFSFLIINFLFLIFLASCSVQKQISRSANQLVLKDSSLQTAHVGISIYEPVTNKYWYNYQGDKYFIPASNTKIPTCYAAMKYLGDSLKSALFIERDTAIFILPTGDPTVLHPDYNKQSLIDLLQKKQKKIYTTEFTWKEEALGPGWSWNDYNESYMAERSPLPVYGNLIKWIQERMDKSKPAIIYSVPEINWEVTFTDDNTNKSFYVSRDIGTNKFSLTEGKESLKEQMVPFVTNGIRSSIELLADTIGMPVAVLPDSEVKKLLSDTNIQVRSIKSQPTDSLLKPMMHRSDNFFAEQSLLMVSNEKLRYMNDEKIIDTLLKTDFKDLPQKPRWVDGSGLSRYNLFTPQDFVSILNKMKNEFGMERIKNILPTGGTGTLENYYKADSNYIFAKTGTLSGVVALSGFLYTRKNKLLIFSILVNNHHASATDIRKAEEKFIEGIREKY